MTHSLHRVGTLENLKNDYTIIAISAKGINHIGSGERLRKFVKVAMKYNPSNLGLIICGNIIKYPVEVILERITDLRCICAAFDNIDNLKGLLKNLKEEDIGLSITCAGIYEDVVAACKEVGLEPHSTNHSLGVFGKTEKLPSNEILELTTMCGHHQVSPYLVETMIKDVVSNRITSKEAAENLAKHCPCGFFNVARACKLLEGKREV